jgi:hypothetical protein
MLYITLCTSEPRSQLVQKLGFEMEDRGTIIRLPPGKWIFLSFREFRLALGSTQLPIQWVTGLKQPESQAALLTASAVFRNEWRHISTPSYAFMECIGATVPSTLYATN